VGVLSGVVVLVIAATGILLAYRPQLLRWSSHNYKAASAERLSLADLITKVRAQSAMPSSLTLLREEDASAERKKKKWPPSLRAPFVRLFSPCYNSLLHLHLELLGPQQRISMWS